MIIIQFLEKIFSHSVSKTIAILISMLWVIMQSIAIVANNLNFDYAHIITNISDATEVLAVFSFVIYEVFDR